MAFWTEIHWSEGMFLRPHHLQAGQRWLETILHSGLEAARPFAWGFLDLQLAKEPLENFTLRLDRCCLRMKDGTWVSVPDNTDVQPLDFKDALDHSPQGVEFFFGIPQMQEVRPNSVSLETPSATQGLPRYRPQPTTRRDENTGSNPQTIYTRRIQGQLFVRGQDMTGYEVVRLGSIRRTDRPGALPELEELGAGPLLAVQASHGVSRLIASLVDQVEAKDEVLAREAREHQMLFVDGVAANTEHLLKLHALNESRALLRAMLQNPVLHPYDVFMTWARLVGHLAIFHDELVPGALPAYDHDLPGRSLEQVYRRLVVLLEAMRPIAYVERLFRRQKDDRGRDGLDVELDRAWIDENLEMFVGFTSPEHTEINELERFVKGTFDLKLASPSRAPMIHGTAVSGLRLQVKAVPAGTLPRRQGLHYFKIDKTIGPDRTDYWKLCEQERGIRMSVREGQLAAMEKLRPALYVVLRGT